MKHLTCLFLCLVLLLSFNGCAANEEIEEPVQFYYLKAEVTYDKAEGVIAPEIRDAGVHRNDLPYLLNLYFQGPKSEVFISPFQQGLALIHATQEDQELYLVLDNSLTDLVGLDLTLACACITKTCLELVPVSTVHISVEDGLLDGAHSIDMNANTLLFLDEAAMSSISPTAN